MKTKHIVTLVIVVVVVGGIVTVAAVGASIYNGIVRREEARQSAWSQVENVYQRRLDVVPNLVETVKGYAQHEQETLTRVAEARSLAAQEMQKLGSKAPTNKESLKDFEAVQTKLSASILSLWAVVERYPDLKANEGFLTLQAQLEGTENRIAVERRRFNEATREFNVGVRTFPRNLVASLGDFKPYPYFDAQPGADESVAVDFGTSTQ